MWTSGIYNEPFLPLLGETERTIHAGISILSNSGYTWGARRGQSQCESVLRRKRSGPNIYARLFIFHPHLFASWSDTLVASIWVRLHGSRMSPCSESFWRLWDIGFWLSYGLRCEIWYGVWGVCIYICVIVWWKWSICKHCFITQDEYTTTSSTRWQWMREILIAKMKRPATLVPVYSFDLDQWLASEEPCFNLRLSFGQFWISWREEKWEEYWNEGKENRVRRPRNRKIRIILTNKQSAYFLFVIRNGGKCCIIHTR